MSIKLDPPYDSESVEGTSVLKLDFAKNFSILELGCGNGGQWEGRIESLPIGCSLILSDFSDGMVSTAKNKYSSFQNVSFQKIDIQSKEIAELKRRMRSLHYRRRS